MTVGADKFEICGAAGRLGPQAGLNAVIWGQNFFFSGKPQVLL